MNHNLKATTFYPQLVPILGDVRAALLLSFLLQQGAAPRLLKAAELSAMTGLSSTDLGKARQRLEAFGVLSSKRMSAGVQYAVVEDALGSLLAAGSVRSPYCDSTHDVLITYGDRADHGGDAPQQQTLGEPFAIDAMLAGTHDDVTAPSKATLEVILRAWATLWGVRTTTLRLTPERVSGLRRAMKDGLLLSTFVKAIFGMKHDTWAERPRYNDWKHVLKDPERWAALFDERGMPAASGGTMLRTVTLKSGRRIDVPRDYVWNESDTFMADSGYTFDVASASWVRS